MTPDWTAISTRVTQIIEVLHLGDEPLACTALDHCQRRAAGEPADEAGATIDRICRELWPIARLDCAGRSRSDHPSPVRDRAR